MSRELSDWIDAYLEFTKGSEPPTSYHLWCGLSVIAGVLQRKVRLVMGFEEIYPNLYVVLVGPSGRTRKGVALGIAKSLLQQVSGVSVAPESSSGREAMILAMKRAMANFQDPVSGKVRFHCSITAISEELSVFLGQGDIKYLANLTDWYDSKDSWEYETVGRGKDSLQGVCLNFIGGTAPDWLQSMLPTEAIGGGFTSRVIFVVEEKKGKIAPEHILTADDLILREKLILDLERIHQLRGDFSFSPEGKDAYIRWYVEQDMAASRGEYAVPDPRFSSYCERRSTHLRKLMMCYSASRGDDLTITKVDFDRAIQTLRAVERNMHKTFGGLGKARHSNATEQVLNYIQAVGITTRSALMAKFYRDVDAYVLREIEETMQQMKVVKIRLIPDRADKVYEWVGTGVPNWNNRGGEGE